MPGTWTIVVVVAVLALVLLALFGWRLRMIAARVGSFQCALRAGVRWIPGVAAYTRDQLVWYDVVSLSRRPRERWDRDALVIVDRTVRPGLENGRQLIEARFAHRGEAVELAADPAAFAGLVSWLEAAPPGARNQGAV